MKDKQGCAALQSMCQNALLSGMAASKLLSLNLDQCFDTGGLCEDHKEVSNGQCLLCC